MKIVPMQLETLKLMVSLKARQEISLIVVILAHSYT